MLSFSFKKNRSLIFTQILKATYVMYFCDLAAVKGHMDILFVKLEIYSHLLAAENVILTVNQFGYFKHPNFVAL